MAWDSVKSGLNNDHTQVCSVGLTKNPYFYRSGVVSTPAHYDVVCVQDTGMEPSPLKVILKKYTRLS